MLWVSRLYILLLPLVSVTLPFASFGFKSGTLADAAFALLLLLAVVQGRVAWQSPPRSLLFFAVLSTAALGLASLLPRADAKDLARWVYSMAVLCVFSALRSTQADRNILARSWMAALCLCVASGFVAWGVTAIPGAPALAIKNSTSLGISRLGGFLYPNSLVLFALMSSPFLVTMLREPVPPHGGRRLLIRTTIAALSLTLVLAPSRGTPGLLLALALMAYARGGEGLFVYRRTLVAMALVSGVSWLAVTATGRLPRFPNTSPGVSGWINPKVDLHYLFHRSSLRLMALEPVLGVGPGRFSASLPRVISSEERSNAWPAMIGIDWDPHSFWLGWGAEAGSLTLGLLVGLHVAIFRELRRRGPFASLMSSALVGLAIVGVHLDYGAVKFVWAALGMALQEPVSDQRSELSD